jgi:DNA-binding NarL/FixJ family response regulator
LIRIWVVASSTAMRAGLRTLLQADESLEVSGESRSLAELEESAPEFDVMLLADDVPVPAGFRQGLDFITAPPALAWISDQRQHASELTGLPWRAWGILPLDVSGSELKAAVRALNEGLLVGIPALVKSVFFSQGADARTLDSSGEPLTGRESEVLQFLAQGLANKQIGLALGISEHTVKFHVSAIYAKLGATNRTEAVRMGIQRGLVTV